MEVTNGLDQQDAFKILELKAKRTDFTDYREIRQYTSFAKQLQELVDDKKDIKGLIKGKAVDICT